LGRGGRCGAWLGNHSGSHADVVIAPHPTLHQRSRSVSVLAVS
jgi:hypothetical protein